MLRISRCLPFSSFLLLALLGSTGTNAENTTTVQIEDVWIAEAPPVSRVHAGYFSLSNTGNRKLTLTAVRSEQYGRIEMHLSTERDGIARMQKLEHFDIPPGEAITFAPGRYHLMLFQPRSPLRHGDQVSLEFVFEGADTVRTLATVRKRQH